MVAAISDHTHAAGSARFGALKDAGPSIREFVGAADKFRRAWRLVPIVGLGCIAGAVMWPASSDAAPRLSVTASPLSIEPGDTVTFIAHGGGGTCRLTARLDRTGSHTRIRASIRRRLVTRMPASAKPGTYVVTVTCGRQRTAARFIVHNPNGPDFSLSLAAIGRGTPRSLSRLYRVTASNRAPWRATTARLCVRVSGSRARLTGVKDAASLRSPHAACAIVAKVPSGHAHGFTFRVRSSKPLAARRTLRVAATVTAANSIRAARTFKVGSRVQAGRAASVDRGPTGRFSSTRRARIAHAPAARATTCTTANKIGVAFVADDSGSMVDNDPDALRGQAISVGLDQLPDGSLAGATRFADDSQELFGVTEVTPTSRPAMKSAVTGLASKGNTNYEAAFQAAQAQLAQMGAADRKAVVFLSDGIPSYNDYTTDQAIAAAGIPIFTIGFGSADEGILSDISARSGGQEFTAASADDLQSIFARVIAILTCSNPTVRTDVALEPGQTQTVPFAVGGDDGEFRALAAWSDGHVTVTAARPDASIMSPSTLRFGEQFSDNPTYALLTATNPAIGGWQLKLVADAGNAGTVHVTIDVFKKGLPPLPTHAPLDRKTQGRAPDACAEVFGGGTSKTKRIRFGTQADYDRAASLYAVCGGFGTSEDFEWSLGMKCAFVSAVGVLAGGQLAAPELDAFQKLCSGTDTLLQLESGDWAGVAGQAGCEAFGNFFSEAAGIIAAGATAESGAGAVFFGTATYRAFNAGFKLACAGAFSEAKRWGYNHEDKHESAVARDISEHGKCLRQTTRLGFISWSAANCAGGGGGGDAW